MQEQQVFEYAVIRVVPRVEREEFINVGVILLCAKLKFLGCKMHVDEKRLQAFCELLDIQELKAHLNGFEQICNGDKDAGPIGKLDIASRFRWLTATRSTVVQASKVHPGLTSNGAATLDRLYTQLIL